MSASLPPPASCCRAFSTRAGSTRRPKRSRPMSGLHRLSDLCLILLAFIDDDAVAVATVSLDFGIEFGWQAEIGDLYVVPPARRQGLALRLIEAGAAWARDRGAQS